MTEVNIDTERVDDVPLLIGQQQAMGVPQVLDEVIVTHGNHEGLSVGWLTAIWLAYILSEADHRMCEVEPWAASRQETLSALLSQPMGEKDFTDDRLADILRYLGDDEVWEAVETRLGKRLIRVYALKPDTVRLDSTAAAVYHDPERGTLFRHGHSKDHRPDLAQFKVMLGALDPLGMPVATLVLAGNRDDDGLYVPAIKRARPVVGEGGRLYIGDSKMAALDTRAFLQHSGDYYLVPLPMKGGVPELLERLLKPEWSKQPKYGSLEERKANEDELDKLIAEWTRQQDPENIEEVLQSAGVPASVVETAEDLLNDPQLKHRGYFHYLKHKEIGEHVYEGAPFKFSNDQIRMFAAPCIGEHNEYVYHDILGLSYDEIADLMADGIITTEVNLSP